MTPEQFLRLLEEMVDLKIQDYAGTHLKLNPELGRLLLDKRQADHQRLDQIRSELLRMLRS